MNKEIIIALCAGEASGDLLGAHLIDALKQQYGNIRFVGIGGPRMKAAGLISLEEQEPLAVRGYVEVLGNLSRIVKIRRHLIDQLRKISPHVFVGIDAPNFNLPVAAKLKAVGIPTLHYVSPSVWAWKPERVNKIVHQVNKVLCLFPMEPQLYREAGGKAEYVGHPLAQMLPMENSREAVRERLKLGLTTPVFALLPGSRVSEVDYMAPIFLRTAALILKELPEAVFLMPYPSAAVRGRLQSFLQQSEFQTLPIRLQAAKSELAYMASDVVLVTSGTASLEVALCKRPMVISYKISSLTYSLVKRKIKIPFVGLPNILLNKMVVPELLQNDATPEKLAAAVLDWYYHPARVGELEQTFRQLHQRLKRNTDELAAYEVLTEAGLHLPKPIAQGESETHFAPTTNTPTPPDNQENGQDNQPKTQQEEQTEKKFSENPPEPTFRQPENTQTTQNTLSIPPPSMVTGHLTSAINETSPEDDPKNDNDNNVNVSNVSEAIPSPITTAESDKNYNELIMSNKAKRKSGLFGWLSSLFKSSNEPIIGHAPNPNAPRAPLNEQDDAHASIVAVSRANEEADTPIPADKPAEKLVLEEETVAAVQQPVHLPKSSVLTVNKPNIFDKYKQNNDDTPVANSLAPEQAQAASPAPNIQVPAAKQPALKVKVTAVVRKPEETANVNVQAAPTPTESPKPAVVSVNVAPTIAPAPTPEPTQPQPNTPPVGALAQYINQASMAWLPDSMKNNAANSATTPAPVAPVEPAEKGVEKVAETVATPIVAETPPKPQAQPNITIQIAPKVSNQTEALRDVKLPATEPAPAPVPEPVAIQPAPTPEPAPVVNIQNVQAAAPAPTPTPIITVQPASPADDVPNNSFASIFRHHTLGSEQAHQEDEAHQLPDTDNDTPAQIVLNRSEVMGSVPTNADVPPAEDGVLAPRVSKYSSNPNRYNSGIFF